MSENESVLVLKAFILDSQIETPELVVIAHGKKEVLLSELMAQNPGILQGLVKERAEIYRHLGWEVPDACHK